MDLRYLRYFIAVAEEMNFTRAAERLHTVQPSLSRQIRRLEEIVGVPLFVRDRHELELTEAGRIFLDESRSILEQVNRAMMLARQGARAEAGKISVGFIFGTDTSSIFSNLLPTLKECCPEMQVAYEGMTEAELFHKLEEQEINVAFGPGTIAASGVVSEVILRQNIVVVAPSTHPLARLRKIPVSRLASETLIGPSETANPRFRKFLESIAETARVRFASTIERDNVLSALHAVSLGLGIALIPDYQKSILPGSVVARQLDLDPQPTYELLMYYHKSDRNPALAYFLSIVRECLEPAPSKR
ncbi:MAG TPA: LysR substrate-binding domain-containing protein [Terriglobales bacterium]|nr:LysR substrate-binding domain-containing protein [Terriglobales bacterium]